MPFKNAAYQLRDIRESIDNINAFIGSMDFDAYRFDRKTQAAVERELQIITEAAIRLGADADTLCPGQDWKGYRAMGNVLRHEYHRINHMLIWNTVKDELPPLRTSVDKALEDLAKEPLF